MAALCVYWCAFGDSMTRRPVYTNAHALAIHNARKLPEADVTGQIALVREHLAILLSGQPAAAESWKSLADVANMTETLADMRIGSGEEAERVIQEAQDSLAQMWTTAQERGTWALRADERQQIEERLDWMVRLHEIQMRAVSIKEYARAFDRLKARVSAARRGQHGRGVTVVGA